MAWPPQVGELLPRAGEALGVHRKLTTYSLDITHGGAGPKATGFCADSRHHDRHAAYLEAEILSGVLLAPVSDIRANPPHGVNCVAEIPVHGLGNRRERVVPVRTIWELRVQGARPRLVSAFPKI